MGTTDTIRRALVAGSLAAGVALTGFAGVASAAPDLNSTAAPTLNSTAAPALNSTAAPALNSTAAPALNSTAAPALNSTAAPALNSTAAPDGNVAEPVLGGSPGNPHAQGLGTARPNHIDLGGASATGVWDNVLWQSWGGPVASGSAIAAYVPPHEPNSSAREEPGVVYADDLGTCNGVPSYRTLHTYFPKYGQGPEDATSVPICHE
ncbi:RodZ family helix-turn-helix domain-containing protein [Pseudonocardia phyllosphaerae]|uniref:hypothetical protein n=1 Tax=Pseudonocardia phyllosphaerae TaxID=3390502 RepID=UPI00397B702D